MWSAYSGLLGRLALPGRYLCVAERWLGQAGSAGYAAGMPGFVAYGHCLVTYRSCVAVAAVLFRTVASGTSAVVGPPVASTVVPATFPLPQVATTTTIPGRDPSTCGQGHGRQHLVHRLQCLLLHLNRLRPFLLDLQASGQAPGGAPSGIWANP